MNLEKVLNSIIAFNLFTLAMLPILPQGVISGAIVLLVLLGLIKAITEGSSSFQWKSIKSIFIFTAPFIFYFISSFYSEDLEETYRLFERQIPLILIPFSMYFVRRSAGFNNLRLIYGLTILASFCMLFYAWCSYLIDGLNKDVSMGFYITSHIGVHASYISIILIAAMLMSINILFDQHVQFRRILKVLLPIVMLIFMFTILVLSSRMALILMILIVPVYIWLYIKETKFKLIISALFIITALVMLPMSKRMMQKFAVIQEVDMEGTYKDNGGKKNPRIRIYKNTWRLIQEDWIFGIGMGDQKSKLIDQYQKDGFVFGVQQQFNTHNQYLSFWLSSGILTLLLFIFSIGWMVFYAHQQSDWLMFSVILLLAFCFLTENLLQRQLGIVLYAYYCTLFILNGEHKKGGSPL